MSDFSTPSQDGQSITISSFGCISTNLAAFQAGAQGSKTWPTANRAIYIPFVVPGIFVAQKMSWLNVTPAGNVDVGIYDSQGTRLVSSGSTAGSGSNAIQTVDITDTTISQSFFYMSIAMDGNTATLVGKSFASAWQMSACGILTQATAFTLPATATFATPAELIVPFLMVSGRVLI